MIPTLSPTPFPTELLYFLDLDERALLCGPARPLCIPQDGTGHPPLASGTVLSTGLEKTLLL